MKRRRASRNSAIAERSRDVDVTVVDPDDGSERVQRRTKFTPPRLTRGHMREPATIAAARIARRVDLEPYRVTRDGAQRTEWARQLGSGNFGVAYLVETDDGPRVVKVPVATDMHRRVWSRVKQTRNIKHEAGVANELVAKGYTVVPRTVYTEFEGGTPAIVREYGEPAGTITGAEYAALERELFEIERKHRWGVHDDLVLYRRTDGSLFVADVGFWTAPRVRAKGQKRREWRAFDSDLQHLLHAVQKAHGIGSVPTLAELLRLAEAIDGHVRSPKRDAMDDEIATEYLGELDAAMRKRSDAGVPSPREVERIAQRARRSLAPPSGRRSRR